jgi:Protein of unknown function (DUF1601)
MNTYTASPEAIRKLDAGLKDLRFVHRGEVKSNLQETVQAIGDSLQHARAGGNYARLFFNLGKAAQAHPALLTSLRKSACWQQIEALLNAVATDKAVYRNPVAVSQIAAAQVGLSMYSQTFSQHIPENCMRSWNAQAASNVVYAYGKLHSVGVVRNTDEKLQKLQIAIFLWHAPELGPQGVSNCCWSFAKQALVNDDAVLLLKEAVVRTSRDMNAQEVANTLWAFATIEQPLGAAQEPLMDALLRVSGEMNAQDVANTLWVFATMVQPLGAAQEPLMDALLRVSGDMNAQDVANTLWAISKLKLQNIQVTPHLCNAVIRIGGCFSEHEVPQVRQGLQWMKLQCQDAALLSEAMAVVG